MQYGHFGKGGKEYIIKDPNTPRPWHNYLFNDKYHALVSQSGGGFSYFMDPKYHRVLRYDGIYTDRPGRYVFMHDLDSHKYWSLNWQPFRKKGSFKCVHGLGYTRLESKNNGIYGEITYFVPRKEPCELWLVKLRNDSNRKRRLRVFPYADFIGGDIMAETNMRMIAILYNRAEYVKKSNTLFLGKVPFPGRTDLSSVCFMSTSAKPGAVNVVKDDFLGRYNDVQSPEAVIRGKADHFPSARGREMVGAFQLDITLPPGAEKTVAVVLGCTDNKTACSRIVRKYNKVKSAKAELAAVLSYWDDQAKRIEVETPDERFNTMVNYWGKYQLFAITYWRGTSHYHGSEGGQGYRDTAQDVEALLTTNLEVARSKLEKLLFYQYNSGHAVSGWSDIEGPWYNAGEGGTGGKADVAIWVPFSVVSYVKETGDVKFLKKKIKYHNGGDDTVFNHIIKAVRFVYNRSGAHGLPLIDRADWNDAYDSVGTGGKGESVWLAMAVVRAAKAVKELADHIKDKKISKEMDDIARKLTVIINRVAWDGKWYVAAFNDKGLRIGSHKNKEGKYPLNSQTWAILSGVVPEKRLSSILKVIDRDLNTPWGPMLCDAYTEYDPGIGRVTSFDPGTKENAAVFSHACAFKVVADCMLKRGEQAYQTFSRLLPCSEWKDKNIETFKVEPYVYSEFVVGPANKHSAGEGSFTWNTGTTPWMWIAAIEYILGAHRDFDGIRIDPCLPKSWKKVRIKRTFRGDVYDIRISNPKGLVSGIKEVKVDGKIIDGTLIKPFKDGKTHRVDVLMG